MGIHLNDYSVILIALGLLTFALSFIIFKRMGSTVDSFGYIMAGIALWAVSYGIELSVSTLEQMLFFIRIEYIGIAFLPALWIIFIFRFIGNDKWLRPLNLFAIFKIPVMTLLFVWTNELHHWHYKTVSVDNSGPFPLLNIEPGAWYYVHTVYFYTLMAWGLYLLVSKFRNADAVFKKQNRIILFAALIPWMINLMYLLGLKPYGHLDLTPFGFILTSLIIGIGLIRFRLFDIVPIARGRIIEAMQEGILVVDTKNRIIDANNRMRVLLKPYAPKLIGMRPEDIPMLNEKLSDISENQGKNKFEIRLDEDGKPHYFSATVTSLFEKDTVYSGQIFLFRDITERKKNEEHLRSLNTLKDRLFSIISHDLRSPLNSFLSLTTMANEGQLTAEEFKLMLPELTKNLGYTSGLVDNLLQWSKTQLQGETIHPIPMDLDKVAGETMELFQKSTAEKNITIVNTIPESTIIYADENMVKTVFRNLISNAVKFSKEGGLIRISMSQQDDFTVICVKDNGVGISDEDKGKLFGLETFTNRGTNNEQGTGLGLMLCKDFVEKNKGKIWVESTVGEGSTFCFTLPRKYSVHTAKQS